MKKFKVGVLVRIKSNCSNTRKPVYQIYAVVEKLSGIYYVLEGYTDLRKELFTKEMLEYVKS